MSPLATVPATFELRKIAEADFPSRFGHFRILGFQGVDGEGSEDAVVLQMGDISTPEPVLVRIHSQCLTGDVFHSLRCDCRAQLELAIESIAKEGRRRCFVFSFTQSKRCCSRSTSAAASCSRRSALPTRRIGGPGGRDRGVVDGPLYFQGGEEQIARGCDLP